MKQRSGGKKKIRKDKKKEKMKGKSKQVKEMKVNEKNEKTWKNLRQEPRGKKARSGLKARRREEEYAGNAIARASWVLSA